MLAQGTRDTQGVQTDKVLPLVLEEVEADGRMKVALHLEPYPGEYLRFAPGTFCVRT